MKYAVSRAARRASKASLTTLAAGICHLCCHIPALADAPEWAGFDTPVAAARTGPVPDRSFQDLKQDGPWSRTSELALTAVEQGLLASLRAGQWADALKLLKQDRPDLNRGDETGATPLSLAARAGQVELVREMLRQGAVADAVGVGGMTPLGAASFAGHELVVRELLRNDARWDVPMSGRQYPLHLACASGQRSIVRLLVQAGADWRLPNGRGHNAVEEAAYFGQVPTLVLLKDLGADLKASDAYRLNAVHAAALGEQTATVDWLLGQGVVVPSLFSQLLIERAREGVGFNP